jgi:glycosyltransferase involved in cell wall biosynthesis
MADVDMRPLNVLTGIRATHQLWDVLKKKHFDLAHLHSSKAGLLGRPICKLSGLHTAYTPHGFSFESVRHNKTKFHTYMMAERFLGRATDRMVCVSEAERETARNYRILPDERISVIHGFADEERWKPRGSSSSLKRKLGISESDSIVGTISRFHLQKAPGDFITMAATLLRTHPNTRFLFVGEDGPLREGAEKHIRELGLQDKVIIQTWTDELHEFVALMDVVVLNSLWEGLPLSLIEAMMMGKPIVATDVPGTRELILNGCCGSLVPPSQPEAMANEVGRLLDSPDRMADLGRRGAVKAQSDYGIEQAVRQTAELYLEMAHSRRVSSSSLTLHRGTGD